MSQRSKKGKLSFRERLAAFCPEREIFLRSGGRVKFIRISRRAQLGAAGILSALFVGWGALTIAMVADNSTVAHDRALLAERGKAVASEAGKVEHYRKSVEELTRDLEERQDFMDDLYRTHFGAEDKALSDRVVGSPDAETGKGASQGRSGAKIGMAPETAPLMKIDARQRRFALLLATAVERRADKAAAAIRSFGLNPDSLSRSAARAQGGPFVPWPGERDDMPQELARLASALSRMEFLESSLIAIPSGKPTAAPMETSSYGYRRDPFNGHAAFHAGIDFPGRHGQPVLAAAKGKVVYVGQRQGYGNVIEVEHGNGLMTRYAHLSGFSSRVGQAVARGDTIGRMGSTGRSTGTHLHFEVRLDGQPINPRRFLEARQDVLQVQQTAKARFAGIGDRG
ncbi:M23 family metallopeptidase [Sphingobium cloacae]|uniref:M23 family metallopeptidase n=1 Tax=Sphingobium cloacae TaxID=120107 RepID=UPI00083589D7|nr:M23 family metallopeptidase [Sphingobium cloacae]